MNASSHTAETTRPRAEYRVETVKPTVTPGKALAHLDALLNEYASTGWLVKSIVSNGALVDGTIGSHDRQREGLVVIFERLLGD
jgi:hypothetical protein